ncbi:MAG: 50S ribosomal protein L25, partial [Phycisphaerales bacterium]|nr:50S ribosomal protein L25 [Phycisphaerales bacterium]
NIPESVMVDVSGLGIGDKLTYGDIPLPEGGKIIGDPTKTFASVEVPVEMPDEEEAPVAEEAPAEETPSEE